MAAVRLLKATQALQEGTVGAMMVADEAIETYRRLVQRDLGLEESTLPAWGSEDDPGWEAVGRPCGRVPERPTEGQFVKARIGVA